MAKFKALFARLLLTILLSCSLLPNTPFQTADAPQAGITIYAAAKYNAATIKNVQKKLNRYGYDCGTPDGIAGNKTKKAVKKYQKDNDLAVTGTINAKLLKSLGIKPVKNPPSTSTGSQNAGSPSSSSSSSSQSGSSGQADTNGLTVYITDTGSKYHRNGCRYLSRSQHAISKSDAQARGYGACSVCRP